MSPGVRTPLGAAGTYSGDWGFARARVRRPDGTTQTVSVNGDDSLGAYDPTRATVGAIVPAAFSIHEAAGEWDAGEYAGWRRFGLTLRRRLFVTPGGATTSLAGAGNAQWSLKAIDGSLAIEQTIPVTADSMVILRLGGGYGIRHYVVALPDSLDSAPSNPDDFIVPYNGPDVHFDLRRADTRVEPLLGFVFPRGLIILSLQPYFVVFHGALRSTQCFDCLPGVELLGFTQNWGLSVALTLRTP